MIEAKEAAKYPANTGLRPGYYQRFFRRYFGSPACQARSESQPASLGGLRRKSFYSNPRPLRRRHLERPVGNRRENGSWSRAGAGCAALAVRS